jgi:MFS family permease
MHGWLLKAWAVAGCSSPRSRSRERSGLFGQVAPIQGGAGAPSGISRTGYGGILRVPYAWSLVDADPSRSSTGAVRRLAVARLVSQIGTQAAYIALLALIFQRSGGSGLWLSVALLASLGARVAVSPWAGAIGDYFDRRRVLIGSDLTAAVCFVGISQAHSLLLLVVLAAVAAVAEAPFGPAASAMVAMVVSADRRGWANGSVAAGSSVGMLFGAVCGGILVAAFGAPTAFDINAVSFLGSALLVYSIKGRYRVEQSAEVEHRGALRGAELVWSHRVLRTSTCSFALVALALGMMNVAEYPLFVHLGVGKVGFGVAAAAWGAGQIAAARLASRIRDAHTERRVLIGASALLAAAVGLSGAVPLFAFVVGAFLLGGVGNTFASMACLLIAQRWSPPQIQSRVIAAVEAIVNTALGASLVVGGVLLSPLGASGVFIVSGTLGALAAATALRIPRDKEPLKLKPEHVPPTPRRTGELRLGTCTPPLLPAPG